MTPAPSKANYKSYEAQARLVRAIVAAHPTTKWNYKEIAACYGSDMTENAANHRFRYIKAQSEIIIAGRKVKLDMKDLTPDETMLPKTVGAVDKNNIAKYFGQSTADGIQFQFRAIKKDASQLRSTVDNGGDPSTCLDLGSSASTGGTSFTPTTTPKTSRSRNLNTPTTGGASTKRRAAPTTIVKIESDGDSDDGESSAHNWSEMEETPSKRPKKMDALMMTSRPAAAPHPGQKNGTPARAAAARASATIADASAQLAQTSESEVETPTGYAALPMSVPASSNSHSGYTNNNAAARPSSLFATHNNTTTSTIRVAPVVQHPPSLFGNVPAATPAAATQQQPPPFGHQAFSKTGTDAYFGSAMDDSIFTNSARNAFYDDDDEVDGEF